MLNNRFTDLLLSYYLPPLVSVSVSPVLSSVVPLSSSSRPLSASPPLSSSPLPPSSCAPLPPSSCAASPQPWSRDPGEKTSPLVLPEFSQSLPAVSGALPQCLLSPAGEGGWGGGGGGREHDNFIYFRWLARRSILSSTEKFRITKTSRIVF